MDLDRTTTTTVFYTDASAYAIGGRVGQDTEQGKYDKPTLFWSRTMKDAESRYWTRELLALVETSFRLPVPGRTNIDRQD
ncbi:MAG: hypothetical protein BJ554DRAFT_7050 [Olpidium bornovanus]|uniref:Reverse transcriptase/retrotransposon-derived protein RNase H-like domain-containing protein n=1 Tax=Olpidium bornovanus TaxID=278681 RepID=A0A8H8DK83_9FUNG|nr:MAG: hypothetical protein BJ554DRAFT_7050 [Olpidium bornovanus]